MNAVTAMSAAGIRNPRRLAALFCLGLFLLIKVFAASEILHHSLHSESTAPEHRCVLTLVAQGQFSAPDAVFSSVVVALGFLLTAPLFNTVMVSSFDSCLAPTRGPPRY